VHLATTVKLPTGKTLRGDAQGGLWANGLMRHFRYGLLIGQLAVSSLKPGASCRVVDASGSTTPHHLPQVASMVSFPGFVAQRIPRLSLNNR
jgi:hypothetical protein